ncbi:MAG: TlyA family RNA methyltransferase [Erysipelotrichia bacterium]|nr:TlyA family RNA methyltransferase [Erysipelotrichia bacterium]NCC55168.1 TlyA family RNA methyltransferase [Erysipelotrichia bacterium]
MKRLDIYLFEQRYVHSRSLAQDAIKESRVKVNDKIITKASFQVCEDDKIEFISKEHEFASRGGNKLYYALKEWQIDLKNKVVLDVGASTGGFSDVCLQEGARFVYAVDIGKEQLIERLRKDTRVKNMEGVNCRYLNKAMFEYPIDFVCMDVSFISIKLIVDAILSVVDAPFTFVFLIKPQFEAGKANIGKNGIVKDKKVHKLVLSDFIHYFSEKGLGIEHLMKSKVVGRDGNQEYLIHLTSQKNNKVFNIDNIIKG